MRLIDADALREYWLNGGSNENIYNTNDFLYELDKAPTIGPESLRPHGEWKHTSSSADPFCEVWECSCCGAEDENGCCYNYCPNCGAKMGGAEDE